MYPREWTSYRLRWQTIYFEDESDRYELKRYSRKDPNYAPSSNYCLSVIKPSFIFDKRRMKRERVRHFPPLSHRSPSTPREPLSSIRTLAGKTSFGDWSASPSAITSFRCGTWSSTQTRSSSVHPFVQHTRTEWSASLASCSTPRRGKPSHRLSVLSSHKIDASFSDKPTFPSNTRPTRRAPVSSHFSISALGSNLSGMRVSSCFHSSPFWTATLPFRFQRRSFGPTKRAQKQITDRS